MVDEFFNSITILEEEKKAALFYLRYRGIAEHEYVRDYLQSVSTDKVSYAQIATAMRYDKRIRRIVFKYIGLLEESIRAYICNKYRDNYDCLDKAKGLEEALATTNDLYKAIASLTFNKLISQIKKHPENDIRDLFKKAKDDLKTIKKDLSAIVELRNECSHNRFLLSNSDLLKNSSGDKNGSLWSNLLNLREYLPYFAKDAFTKEINDSAKASENKYENESKWELVEVIIIRLT